ncbi:MAG: YdaS family helix-turn-helix protein [Verrucomicrobiota bacterium]
MTPRAAARNVVAKEVPMMFMEYIKTVEDMGAFAAALGVSASTVRNWRRGTHKPSPAQASKIQEVTHGVVQAAELYPDIFNGWKRVG